MAGLSREGLSARELEVLILTVEGWTSRQIAYELGVVEVTVEQHVTSILRKLDVPSQTGAAVTAFRLEIIR